MMEAAKAQKIKELFLKLEAEDPIKLDPWQKQVIETDGSLAIRAGRQVGKSFVIGEKKVPRLAVMHEGSITLMVAAAQRQSSQLFQKSLKTLLRLHDAMLDDAGGWKDDPKKSKRQNMEARRIFELEHGLFEAIPTKTEVRLKNGSVIYSLPTGKTGAYIRCYSVDFLVADEAAFIPEPVWTAILPMLAVSKKMRGLGWEITISTPFGKGGHFYECFHDTDYRTWHISSETCRRIPRDWITKQREKMSKLEYAQEIQGEFIDEFNQFFSTALIKRRMDFMEWDRSEIRSHKWKFYLGVDIARYGADENAFVVAALNHQTNFVRIVKVSNTQRVSLVGTVGYIKTLDKEFHFGKIFIDSTGVGGGALDMLLDDDHFKRRVVGLENAKKSIDAEGRSKKIFKEDLYSNAAVIMEKEPGSISIINNLKLLRSLRSMTFSYNQEGNLKIYGKYSHFAEAFVRALWCVKSKHLNLFLA